MGGIVVKGDARKALDDLSARIGAGRMLRVGFLENAKYPDGTPVGGVAALANFGHGPTPPRPFFTNYVDRNAKQWADVLEAALQATNQDVDRALAILGEHMVGGLQQSIIETMSPPLSKITLWLRKWKRLNPGKTVTGSIVGEAARAVAAGEDVSGENQKPLIETSHMLNSAAYEVEKK